MNFFLISALTPSKLGHNAFKLITKVIRELKIAHHQLGIESAATFKTISFPPCERKIQVNWLKSYNIDLNFAWKLFDNDKQILMKWLNEFRLKIDW